MVIVFSSFLFLIILLVIIDLALSICGEMLMNRAIWIKNINPNLFRSYGDLKFDSDSIHIKFFWNVKSFTLYQVSQIKAYAQTTWSLEDLERVDVIFKNGDKIYLSVGMEAHRKFIRKILSGLGAENKILEWGFLPHSGDHLQRDIVYDGEDRRSIKSF